MAETTNQEPLWIAGVKPPDEVLGMTMVPLFERECREQPKLLAELVRAYGEDPEIRGELGKLREVAAQAPSLPVLFSGMGGSFCSAVTGTVLLQASGRSSFVVESSEWLHYALPAWDQVACTVLQTTSGESAELVELFKKNPGRPMALVCNNEQSKCWKMANLRLPILAGPEYGNATKTYTNSTAVSVISASEIVGRPWQADAARVLDVFGETLDQAFAMRDELAAFCEGTANIEVIGRGAAYGGAFMGALCIREMAGPLHRAAAHTGGGFKHGPNLDISGTHLAIIMALGRAAHLGVKLAEECNSRGGKVILVGTEDHPRTEKLLPVKIAAVPEFWEGLPSVVVPHALTMAFIEKDGANLKPRFFYGKMEQ